MKFSFNLMVLVGEKSGPSTDLYDTVKNRRIYENKVVKVWGKSRDFSRINSEFQLNVNI